MFKKKKPNKFILSCKWKQNFRHSQLAPQKYETLLEEGKQILETVSAINIFTSHSDEKKNTSPQGTSLDSIKMTHTTYYKLSHTILLLCYRALRTSDACAFTRSTTEILSRNQEPSDSHQCCRMGIKKEKEKPAERSARPQPKKVC